MNKINPKIDGYIRKSKQWQEELKALRKIILDCPVTEEVKWRHPCYTFEGHNIVIVGRFKDCCMINFVKGALLKDAKHILAKPGENTQASRVVRFTSVPQITAIASALKVYIREAIAAEKAGLKVKFKEITEHAVAEEFQKKLDEMPALKKAFTALTPGRQRAYLLHFSGAKQSETRASRVEKKIERILASKGMDDE